MTGDRLAFAGPLTLLLATVTVVFAIVVAPTFSVTGDALSDLGVRTGSAPVFNGGLILAGIVGLGFATWLGRRATRVFERVAAVLVAVSMLGLAGVGVFPRTESLHPPAALTFYLGFTYALFLHGTGRVRAGGTTWGLVAIWLGIVHVTGWLAWVPIATWLSWNEIAIPELCGAAIFGGWPILVVRGDVG